MGTRRSSGTFVAIVVSTPCTSPSSVVGAGGRSHRPVASATGQSRPGGAPPDRGAAQSLPPPLGSAGVLARKPIEWAFVVNFVELPLPPGPARPRLGDSHLGPLRPPVPRRASAARRPASGGLRGRHHGPSTDRAVGDGSSRKQRGRSATCLCWWRWGDSNSRPAASFQGFSERSRRLSFGPGLSGGDAPGS